MQALLLATPAPLHITPHLPRTPSSPSPNPRTCPAAAAVLPDGHLYCLTAARYCMLRRSCHLCPTLQPRDVLPGCTVLYCQEAVACTACTASHCTVPPLYFPRSPPPLPRRPMANRDTTVVAQKPRTMLKRRGQQQTKQPPHSSSSSSSHPPLTHPHSVLCLLTTDRALARSSAAVASATAACAATTCCCAADSCCSPAWKPGSSSSTRWPTL